MKQVMLLAITILIIVPDLTSGFYKHLLRSTTPNRRSQDSSIISAVQNVLKKNYREHRYVNPKLQPLTISSKHPGKRLWIMCLAYLCMATERNFLPKYFYKELDEGRRIYRI